MFTWLATPEATPDVAIHLNNLATLLLDTNRFEQAEPLMRRDLKIDEVALGTDHPKVAIRLVNLGSLLQATGGPEEGRELVERGLAILEGSFDTDHPHILNAKGHLASFD